MTSAPGGTRSAQPYGAPSTKPMTSAPGGARSAGQPYATTKPMTSAPGAAPRGAAAYRAPSASTKPLVTSVPGASYGSQGRPPNSGGSWQGRPPGGGGSGRPPQGGWSGRPPQGGNWGNSGWHGSGWHGSGWHPGWRPGWSGWWGPGWTGGWWGPGWSGSWWWPGWSFWWGPSWGWGASWWWPGWGWGVGGWWPGWSTWWGPAWGWGVGWGWAGWGLPSSYAAVMAPVTGVWVSPGNATTLEPAPVQVEPGPDTPLHKLYCPSTARFYPDVLECSQPWWRVLPGEGTAPAQPAPQGAAPMTLPPAATQSVPGNARVFQSVASMSSTDAVLIDIDFGSIVPTYADTAPVSPDSATAQAARNSVTSQVGMKKIPAPPMTLPK